MNNKAAVRNQNYKGPNLGLYFYKMTTNKIHNKSAFNQKCIDLIRTIEDQKLTDYPIDLLDISRAITINSNLPTKKRVSFLHFECCTAYNGLATGLGYSHSSGQSNNEFKLGCFFDHTTGVPVISGSSVKGRLRSFFPGRYGNKQKKKEVYQRIKTIFQHLNTQKKITIPQLDNGEEWLKWINEMEYLIFEGKKTKNGNSVVGAVEQDVFFDAYPCQTTHSNNKEKFLGQDSITPHAHPLKEPIPLRMLKILPNVKIKFQFRFNDLGLSAEDKKILFQYLIMNYGAGAKTNSGFGQFIDEHQLDTLRNSIGTKTGYLNLPQLPKTNTSFQNESSVVKELQLRSGEVMAEYIGADPANAKNKRFKITGDTPFKDQEVSFRYPAPAKSSKAILKLHLTRDKKRIQSAIIRMWL